MGPHEVVELVKKGALSESANHLQSLLSQTPDRLAVVKRAVDWDTFDTSRYYR